MVRPGGRTGSDALREIAPLSAKGRRSSTFRPISARRVKRLQTPCLRNPEDADLSPRRRRLFGVPQSRRRRTRVAPPRFVISATNPRRFIRCPCQPTEKGGAARSHRARVSLIG